MNEEIYVVVAENNVGKHHPANGVPHYDDNGEIIFEAYTKHATLDGAKAFIARLNGQYGKCRIARLEFIDDHHGGAEDVK